MTNIEAAQLTSKTLSLAVQGSYMPRNWSLS